MTPILSRALASLIRTQGIGDLARIYLVAQRTGMGFHLTRVPADFTMEPQEMFDPDYMRALFDLGRRTAQQGEAWVTEEN